MAENAKTLMDGLLEEISRCEELLREYESIPQGQFAAVMIKAQIANAKKSISDNDVVQMLYSYSELQECN